MEEKVIKKEDFVTTSWAGGETTQLSIYPEDAIFSNKDFLWRISSATFTSTGSSFSDFTGYQRYILPLEGELTVQHKGLYGRTLKRYEVEYFDGSWTTTSENSLDCRDYNFIVKSGSLAKMQILNEGDEHVFKGNEIATFFSVDDFTVELSKQSEKRVIEGFSLFVLETKEGEKTKLLSSKSPVILTEFVLE